MISGDYRILNPSGRVCIDTLTSPVDNFLSDDAYIVGSHKTENLGVERIVINLVANPSVRAIIICGRESFGHYAGQALISLWKNGTDTDGRIIGAKGPIPYLENIDDSVVARFREQILYIEDMIGIDDPETVRDKVREVIGRRMEEFKKPPLEVTGISRKKTGPGALEASREKLTVSPSIEIDPIRFTIECSQ